MRQAKRNKYNLYQAAVQDPKGDAELYTQLYQEIYPDQEPLIVREDFCAAFAFSCAWVKRSIRHRALCLDIDPEPLAYGRKVNLAKLSSSQKKRLTLLKQNVISATSPKADLAIAGNFSFYVLKERQTLIRYFKNVRKSLAKGGLLFLESAGGPDFTKKGREQRQVKSALTGNFTYFWEQKSFDPITHDANYAIHFKFPDGSWMPNAFTYPWRLWTIPELRDALVEAGFSDVKFFCEKIVNGKETGEYSLVGQGANSEFWLSYVVGIR